jgi:hypothetical protein
MDILVLYAITERFLNLKSSVISAEWMTNMADIRVFFSSLPSFLLKVIPFQNQLKFLKTSSLIKNKKNLFFDQKIHFARVFHKSEKIKKIKKRFLWIVKRIASSNSYFFLIKENTRVSNEIVNIFKLQYR